MRHTAPAKLTKSLRNIGKNNVGATASIPKSKRPTQAVSENLIVMVSEPAVSDRIKRWNDPNIKIRLTKAGICFSGPTAFPSNLHKSDFVYEGQPYSSPEQGYQHLSATHHLVFDIAEEILGPSDTKNIKDLSREIPNSDEWNRIAPGKLWEIIDANNSQNPELLEMLLDTAPYTLIEVSFDWKWGGGGRDAPIDSPTYEDGVIPGKNIFGNFATTL